MKKGTGRSPFATGPQIETVPPPAPPAAPLACKFRRDRHQPVGQASACRAPSYSQSNPAPPAAPLTARGLPGRVGLVKRSAE